ncbi:hypothetical protein HYN59_01665 [Flavobacterium album]|uniref:Peptidase A2 domain-containing protein n=2 Tax=Flavobacterium album TaxID=2175091 RepID=A0A2S1QU08_9FLAO|nr:hypothetical protein HYN59_01665 [Flavobacterium album]
MLTVTKHYSQVKFEISSFNNYVIRDSVKSITYSFDSGSEHSNLFDKGKFDHKFGGISLIQNANGGFKFIKKGRIREDIPGLGNVRTNANILANEEFAKDNCIPVDLLLGSRAMKNYTLHFDNKRGILSSVDLLPANIDEYIKLELKHGFFDYDYYTFLEVNGHREKFLVDTGYSGQIALESAEGLPSASDSYSFFDLVAFRVSQTTLNRHDSAVVKHNDIIFKNNVVYSFSNNGMNIIGNAFFLNFEDVIFDLKNKCIYLRNEKERYDPFSDDIIFGADADNNIHIVYIKSSSKYYVDGFRIGDQVVLEDKGLERRLLDSPCETIDILRKWKLNNNGDFALSKVSSR